MQLAYFSLWKRAGWHIWPRGKAADGRAYADEIREGSARGAYALGIDKPNVRSCDCLILVGPDFGPDWPENFRYASPPALWKYLVSG